MAIGTGGLKEENVPVRGTLRLEMISTLQSLV